jgi:hypothetical protein
MPFLKDIVLSLALLAVSCQAKPKPIGSPEKVDAKAADASLNLVADASPNLVGELERRKMEQQVTKCAEALGKLESMVEQLSKERGTLEALSLAYDEAWLRSFVRKGRPSNEINNYFEIHNKGNERIVSTVTKIHKDISAFFLSISEDKSLLSEVRKQFASDAKPLMDSADLISNRQPPEPSYDVLSAIEAAKP